MVDSQARRIREEVELLEELWITLIDTTYFINLFWFDTKYEQKPCQRYRKRNIIQS